MRAQVDRLGINLETTMHRYEAAQIELRTVKNALRNNTHRLKVARANFHSAQVRIMARVYALYVSGKPTTLDVLAGAKTLAQVVDRAEAAQTMSQQDSALGRQALRFKQAVQKRQHNLAKLRARRATAVLTLASEKRQIEETLAKRKQLLDSIHTSIHQLQVQEAAHERALRAAYLARLRAEAARQAALQAAPSSPVTIPSIPSVPPVLGGGIGHPQAARLGLQYLGVPYVWGGASPSGFDCSGLVMYVYAQLGISLPHYTVSQWNATLPISMSQLQPGDLVFFNGLGHVGIYIGNGQMVDAPHTGSVVRIDNIYGFGSINGARRVP